MGIQNPQTIAVSLNNLTGLSKSGYPPLNADNRWKLAPLYRLGRVDTMRQLTHLSKTDTMAYDRWASTKHVYKTRFAWQGGEPPFRCTLVKSPTTAYLGSGGKVQTWERTQSTVDTNVYIHNYPTAAYEMTWQPQAGDLGSTHVVRLLVESQDGQVLLIDRTVTVDDTKFKYFDSVNGSDTNAGTFEAPYQNYGYGYASVPNNNNYIYCYKPGTYQVHNGTPGSAAAINNTHCKSFIGLGSSPSDVVFDLSTGVMSKGLSGIFISNLTLRGGPSTAGNVRQLDLDNKTDNFHAHKVIFDTTVIGTTGTDNPSGCMFWDLTSPAYHENIVFTDCILPATAKTEMFVLFQVKNFLIEGCVALNPSMPSNNGAMAIHLKDGTLNGTVRHCDLVGSYNSAVVWLSSQDAVSCGNVDIQYSRIVNTRASAGYVIRTNGQVHSNPMAKPIDYWLQRISIDGLNSGPLTFENYTGLGYPVNYSGLLWKSSVATLDAGGGGVSTGTSSLKVNDIDVVAGSDLGQRGHLIASTLMV